MLVLHSGAGQLADQLLARLDHRGQPVRAVVLVDAGLPTRGHSRVVQLRDEAPEFAEELKSTLAGGGRFPDWTDIQLREFVPDGVRRRRLLDGVQPLPASFWEDPIPDVAAPPCPRGVVLLSGGYEPTARAAEAAGWPLLDLAADNHFLAVAEEARVAEAILDLLGVLLA